MKYAYAILACFFALAGCGGGGGSRAPLNITGYAELTHSDGVNRDGSLYDSRSFTATRDGWIQVSMSSTVLDPFIVVYRGTNEDYEVGHDDDSGSRSDAVFFFHAERGKTYTAKFTTYGSGARTGTYSFTIKEITSPEATRAHTLATDKLPQDTEMKKAK